MNRIISLFLLLLFSCITTEAAVVTVIPGTTGNKIVVPGSYFIIKKVRINGNKKTRSSIIMRELDFRANDTIYYKDLAATLEISKKRLLNTSLFLNVSLNVKNWDNNYADIVIDVWERWYTIAFPIFKLADRNFNQWWVEQKASLNRVNLGIKGFQDNLTGRNDELGLELQVGYTQKVILSYVLPYIDKNLQHGLGFVVSYSRNREVNDTTILNKQHFFKQDDFLRKQWLVGLQYTYRPAIRSQHRISLNYNYEYVSDSVAKVSPSYLGDGRTEVKYLELAYRFNYIDADSWVYPLKGTAFRAELTKAGLLGVSGLNYFKIRLKGTRYWELDKKFYAAAGARFEAKYGADQPYIAQKGMGYLEDYLRGLEYYVVDGTTLAIAKSTLRYELFNFKIRLPLVPKKFSAVPFRIFAKTYADAGYVYSKFPGDSFLDERFLYTGGFGLDIVSFYDACLRIEYSFNQLGQNGLFLHTKIDM